MVELGQAVSKAAAWLRAHPSKAAGLALYMLVMLVLGALAGDGYSVEVRGAVIHHHKRLSVRDLDSSSLCVAARVRGLAYERLEVNASSPWRVTWYPYAEGNLTCTREAGLQGVYVCVGEGYVYKPVGLVEEFIGRGNTTSYYYFGTYSNILIYCIETAVFIGLVLAPFVTALTAYTVSGDLSRRGHAAFTATAMLMFSLTALHSLASTVPGGVPGLRTYLGAVTAASLAAIAASSYAARALHSRVASASQRAARPS
ncbi:MAG: hypothetical protein ABWW70_00605 [Thermoproteota archaeon]